MFNFYFIYMGVLIIAMAQWAYMRLMLSRGLEIHFQKFRQVRSMDFFFKRFAKPYLTLLVWTLFYVGFIGYSAIRLLSDVAMLNMESGIFSLFIVLFFGKDRIYYVTALYVLSKDEGKL